jgi:ankyrin repeat protein
MASPLSKNELYELSWAFGDLTDDSMAPIDPLTYRTYENDNCLHIAALRGNLRAVELLVKVGLDVNDPGDCGCTPLHYAYIAQHAHHGNGEKVVAFLLAHGARQDIEDGFGNLPKRLDERTGY